MHWTLPIRTFHPAWSKPTATLNKWNNFLSFLQGVLDHFAAEQWGFSWLPTPSVPLLTCPRWESWRKPHPPHIQWYLLWEIPTHLVSHKHSPNRNPSTTPAVLERTSFWPSISGQSLCWRRLWHNSILSAWHVDGYKSDFFPYCWHWRKLRQAASLRKLLPLIFCPLQRLLVNQKYLRVVSCLKIHPNDHWMHFSKMEIRGWGLRKILFLFFPAGIRKAVQQQILLGT